MTYRILSLDGGGIRGYFTCGVLERLLAKRPGLLAGIDLIAGTSTGGIIALGLGRGMTPTQLKQLYRTRGAEIFDDGWFPISTDLGGIAGADYDNDGLKRILAETFGKATLGTLGKRVLIPAYDLHDAAAVIEGVRTATGKPKFFHNFPGPGSDAGELLVDVALATSAAPTYFPTHKGYIDGGVHANNPAMAALAQAIHAKTGGQQLGDVLLLSIGTVIQPAYIDGDKDWGVTQWAKPLVNILLDAGMQNVNYQCTQLLGDRFVRVNAVNPAKAPFRLDMDDVSDRAFARLDAFIAGVDIPAVLARLDAIGF